MICALCNDYIDADEKPSMWNGYSVHDDCLQIELGNETEIDPKYDAFTAESLGIKNRS